MAGSNLSTEIPPVGGDAPTPPEPEKEPSKSEQSAADGDIATPTDTATDATAADPADTDEVPTEPLSSRGLSSVTDSVRTNNALIGNNFWGAVYFGTEDTIVVPLDRTEFAKSDAATFVRPADFDDQVQRILTPRSVLLLWGGRGVGKRLLASLMLGAAGNTPVLELPGDLPVDTLAKVVRQIAQENPTAGVVVDSLQPGSLRKSRDLELLVQLTRQFQKLRVVLTSESPPPQLNPLRDVVPAMEVRPPEPELVAEKLLGKDLEQVAPLVRQVLARLDGPLLPDRVVHVVEECRTQPIQDAQSIASRLSATKTTDSLRQWFEPGRSAADTALLTALAACSGTSEHLIHQAARSLATYLHEPGVSPEQRLFALRTDVLPPGLSDRTDRELRSHFGVTHEPVLALRDEHDRPALVNFLWRELDAGFQATWIEWLNDLVIDRDESIWVGAALTAGLLFVQAPKRIEAELLRPWSHGPLGRRRFAAALAVGVPTATGIDSSHARALAHFWSREESLRARQTAIYAYGSLLGAWDSASAASSHLWRIGAETPALQGVADLSLGQLVAAGPEAARVRAAVMLHIRGFAGARATSRRAFSVLPHMTNALTGGDLVASESLDSLRSLAEATTWDLFVRLLLRAATVPEGEGSARHSIHRLIVAIAYGDIDDMVLLDLIREMRRKTKSESQYTRLGKVLSSEFDRAGRESDAIRRTADRLSKMFFGRRR